MESSSTLDSMPQEALYFTARATAEMLRRDLEQEFRDVQFRVRIDRPGPPFQSLMVLSTIVVSWEAGVSREDVEGAIARYQGLEWNHETGLLEERQHFVINPDGKLQRMNFGVDYVLCEGPLERQLPDS